VRSVLPLALVHTLGNLLTNVSLGAVAVSFTHTIKAMEPFFSVLLSALFLGDRPSLAVGLTLFPIIGGVAMASMAEVGCCSWEGLAALLLQLGRGWCEAGGGVGWGVATPGPVAATRGCRALALDARPTAVPSWNLATDLPASPMSRPKS
jgi:hypothetical protein